MSTVTDFHGKPLSVGDAVRGWYDDVEYRAVVKWIAPQYGTYADGFRHIVVTREDGTEHSTFSDAVCAGCEES
jgi:hypothetical protein